MTASEVRNFGNNLRFRPRQLVAPKNEAELLTVLQENLNDHVRVMGAKHAWSPGIETDGVLLEMRHFNHVRIHQINGAPFVTAGAGCPLKVLLKALNEQGLTTPSVGLITEQTIAGATATGTHGSGRHSLSHYVHSVRIACFDEAGETAQIVDICEGNELRAARCSLGCLGVIVEITLPCVPQYFVEEKLTPVKSIEEALALEADNPLQQFFLLPHAWTWFVQQRKVVSESGRRGGAKLYRIYWFLFLDIGLHLLVMLFAVWLRSRRLVHFLFHVVVPCTVFPRWITVDRSDRQLVMEHELFRHLEEEIFVRRSNLLAAAHFVTDILKLADHARHTLSPITISQLNAINSLDRAMSIRGCFTHHYPICFRRILPDDTLISMASGAGDDWYSISLITYREPRDDFYQVARFLAESMSRLFQARLHWGKWCPLTADRLQQHYPDLSTFRTICQRFDPNGVFRNTFIRDLLNL
jgi:FAD/FMN-containing dehydrogenase